MCVECVTGSLTLTSLQIVNIMILQHYAFMTIIYSNGLFNYDEPLRWAIKFSSITFHDMCVVCNGLVFNFDEPSDSKHNDTTALLAIKILPSYLHIMSILMYSLPPKLYSLSTWRLHIQQSPSYPLLSFIRYISSYNWWRMKLISNGCTYYSKLAAIDVIVIDVSTSEHVTYVFRLCINGEKTYYVHYRARASPQEVISISYHFWLCQLLISPQLEHLLSTLITTRLRTTTTLLYSLYPFGIPNCFTSHVCVRLIHL